jgi:hypothetical protein
MLELRMRFGHVGNVHLGSGPTHEVAKIAAVFGNDCGRQADVGWTELHLFIRGLNHGRRSVLPLRRHRRSRAASRFVAQPYVTRVLLSDTAPRSVTARGNLGRRTIDNRIVRASLTIGGAGCRATGQ